MYIVVNAIQKVTVTTWERELNGALYCVPLVLLNTRPILAKLQKSSDSLVTPGISCTSAFTVMLLSEEDVNSKLLRV